MNLRISNNELRYRLTLEETRKLHNDKVIKEKFKVGPNENWIEYGVEIGDGFNEGEFIDSIFLLKISLFELEKIESGDELIFSSKIKNTDTKVIVEVDRMSRVSKKKIII